MSYRLDAVVGDFDRLRSWAGGVPGAVVAPLRQRMGLLPLSPALRGDLPRVLGDLSRGGPVAHVQADFWGGQGDQTAALWRAGVQEWGPVHTSEFSGPREDWPINAALARLGVAPAGPGAPDYRDRFVEAGLGEGRDQEDWHRAARQAREAADYDEWHAREQARREGEERAAVERAATERLSGIPVPLDGKEVIALLGLPQGPTTGAAIRHLRQLHIDRGPQSREEAEAALRAWAAEQGLTPATAGPVDTTSPLHPLGDTVHITYSPVAELNLLKDFQDRVGYENFARGFGLTEYGDTSALSAWSEAPDFTGRLVPFAQATGGGSFYALWRLDDRDDVATLPVVVFGDEGGEHVVARHVRELFQLLGYDEEISVDHERAYFYRDEDEPHTDRHDEYAAWLDRHFGLPVAKDPDAVLAAAQAEFGGWFADWIRPFLP